MPPTVLPTQASFVRVFQQPQHHQHHQQHGVHVHSRLVRVTTRCPAQAPTAFTGSLALTSTYSTRAGSGTPVINPTDAITITASSPRTLASNRWSSPNGTLNSRIRKQAGSSAATASATLLSH